MAVVALAELVFAGPVQVAVPLIVSPSLLRFFW